jgi:hypothetical protein
MSQLPIQQGGLRVLSGIVPSSSASTYGTHYSYLGVGGYVEVPNIDYRNSIPSDSNMNDEGYSTGRRRYGMIAYVINEDKLYRLFPYSGGSIVSLQTFTGASELNQVTMLSENAGWVEVLSSSVLITGGTYFSGSSSIVLYNSTGGTVSITGVTTTDVVNPGDGRILVSTGNSENVFVAQPNMVFNGTNLNITGGTFVTNSGGSIDSSAIVQFKSTTKGFLPPVMTTAQKNAIINPTSGLTVYDSTIEDLSVYTSSGWTGVITERDTLQIVTNRGNTTTNAITVGGLVVNGTIQNTIGSANLFTSNVLGTLNISLHASTPTTGNYFIRTDTQSLILNTPAAAGSMIFRLNNTSYGQFFTTTGNLTLQNGGTFTDSGFRLDVNGTTRFQGASTFTGSTTASTTVARGALMSNTLVAAADNDTLVGLDITPTFNVGSFTGVTRIPLRMVFGSNYFGVSNIIADGITSLHAAAPTTSNYFIRSNNSNIIFNSPATDDMYFRIANNDRMRLFGATGNFLIQNGGSFTDAGFRFDVNGTVRIQGTSSGFIFADQVGNTSNFALYPKLTPSISNYILRTDGSNTILNSSVSTGVIGFRIGNTSVGQFFGTTGNFILQNGGTLTDDGFRLDVNGTTRFQGASTFTGSTTASTTVARGVLMSNTLVATSNSDTLVGLDINPTFTNGAFTGATNISLRSQGLTVIEKDLGLVSDSLTPLLTIRKSSASAQSISLGYYTRGASGTDAVGISMSSIYMMYLSGDTIIGGYTRNGTFAFGLNPTTQGYVTGTNIASNGITFASSSSIGTISTATSGPAIYVGSLTSGAGDLIIQARTAGTNKSIYMVTGGATAATSMVVFASTNVAIGTTTDAGFRLDVNGTTRFQGASTFTGSTTASTAVARGVLMSNTLVASADNDTLVGLDINPTFTNGAFTGVTNLGLRVNGTIQNTIGTASLFTSNIIGGSTITFHIGTPTVSNYFFRCDGANTGFNAPTGFLYFRVGNTSFGQFHSTTGNLTLQNGGTFTDAGFRLDVNGTTRFQGSSTFTGSTTASTAVARGVLMNNTLVAAANGDTLVGLDINPTFTVGGFTGTTSAALRVAGNIIPSITNTYSIGTSPIRFKDLWLQGLIAVPEAYINNITFGQTNFNFNNSAGTTIARWFGTGNLVIQNGGSFTDAGYLLDVQGIGRFSGLLRGDSGFIVGGTTTTNTANARFWSTGGQAPTSGLFRSFYVDSGWIPSSGSSEWYGLDLRPTINQTGSANGITRGIYIAPTITSAVDFRALETTVGKVIFGSTSGNVLIGTSTDAGYRLDVNGTARIQNQLTITPPTDTSAIVSTGYSVTGSGTTPIIDLSGTWNTTGAVNAFRINITNTASNLQSNLINLQVSGNTLFRVNANTIGGYTTGGPISPNGYGFGTGNQAIYNTDGTGAVNSAGGSIKFSDSLTEIGYSYIFESGQYTNKTFTGGTGGFVSVRRGFAPTSGTGVLNILHLQNTINQTGGANGITRGLYIQPTLTSAADFRAIETTVGNVIFGSTSGSVGIGTTSPTSPLHIASSVTAASTIARGVYMNQTLVAAANGDVLVGLQIAPTFTNGAFTGVTNNWLELVGNAAINGTNQLYLRRNNVDVFFASSVETIVKSVSTTAPLRFSIGATKLGEFFATTGNLTLQNGGTFTDAGYRLDVNGLTRSQDTLVIGTTATSTISGQSLSISRSLTGALSALNVYSYGVVQSDVTTRAAYYSTYAQIQNTAFTLGLLVHYEALAGLSGAATINTQMGFRVHNSMTGAGNNYGFYADLSAASGNWNIYMGGTAKNFINGSLFIGSNTDAGYKLDVLGTTRLNGLQTFQGTTASDTAPLGSELLITGTSDASWTGTSFASGYRHITGSTTTLTSTLAGVVGTYYQIGYTVTGRTTGSVTVDFGGSSLIISANSTGTQGPKATTTGTLVITPTSDFNGTLVLSIKTIGGYIATTSWLDSLGNVSIQLRASANNTAQQNTFIGGGSGSRLTTGVYNTAFGYNAGGVITTGSNNVIVGTNAGLNTTVGGHNTFVGQGSGQNNISGYYNTALGSQSLLNNTASSNTAIGYQALTNNTSGNSNTSVGYQSLLFNSTGSNNTSIGFGALFNNTASSNTAIGAGAALTSTSGTGITAIGYQALNVSTANNNTAVGYQSGLLNTSGTNNAFFGFQCGTALTSGSSNAIFGTGVILSTNSDVNSVVGVFVTATGGGNSIVGYQASSGGFNSSVILGRSAIATANNQFVVGSSGQTAGTVSAETNTTISSWSVKVNGTDRKLLLLDTAQNVIDVKQSVTASTTTSTINWISGNVADTTLTSNTTFTLSNPVIGTYIVKLTQGGAGSFVVTWPATVKWSGGIAPVLTTTAGKIDIITLVWDGTNYYGSYALNF